MTQSQSTNSSTGSSGSGNAGGGHSASSQGSAQQSASSTGRTQAMREKARKMKDQGRRKLHENYDEYADWAGQLKSQAASRFQNVGNQLSSQAQGLVDKQKSRAADEVHHIASAFHAAASKLRDENDETIAHYTDDIGDQIDSVAEYLREQDLQGLRREAESFVRNQPALFLGGMFLAGLALARFVKSHHEEVEDSYEGWDNDDFGDNSDSPGHRPTSHQQASMGQRATSPSMTNQVTQSTGTRSGGSQSPQNKHAGE